MSTTEIDLGGGAKLFLEPSSVLPLVSIVVAFRTGSAHDPPGKEGLSRVTARMLRRGSAGLDAMETERAIDRLGGEVSFEVAISSTAVGAQVLARNATAFVDLVAKMIATPAFDEGELARLLRETRAELLETLDNDRALADRFFRKKLFGAHGYGRTSRGTAASIAAIDREAVKAHHRKHYVRENAIVAMSGDVEPAFAEKLARTIVDALPDGTPPGEVLTEPSPITGRQLVFVDKPDRTQTQILIGSLGTSAHDPDHVPFVVANNIFGGTFTSRLTREVRGKRGWSYGASSRLGVDRKRHSFAMWTFPASTDAAACIELEISLLEKLLEGGVTDREIKFMQRYISRSWAFEIDTAQKRVHQALDVEILGLPRDYYDKYLEHVANVTAESANAALRARLDPKNLVIAVVGTAATTEGAVKAKIADLASDEVVPYDLESR